MQVDKLSGSVLICLFGVVLCLCVGALLTFKSLPRGGLDVMSVSTRGFHGGIEPGRDIAFGFGVDKTKPSLSGEVLYNPVDVQEFQTIHGSLQTSIGNGNVYGSTFPVRVQHEICFLFLCINRHGRQFFCDLKRTEAHSDFANASYRLPEISHYWRDCRNLIVDFSNLSSLHQYPSPFSLFCSFGLSFNYFERAYGNINSAHSNKDQEHRWQVCGTKKAAEVAVRFAGGCYCLIFGCLLIYGDGPGQSLRLRLRRVGGPTLVGLGLAAFLFPPYYEGDCEDNYKQPPPLFSPLHGTNNVTQKLLTTLDYCNTIIVSGRQHMANVLSTDKQIAVIGALAEGSSIRSIERITGVHRDTIMRLGVRAGKGCARLLDAKMRDLSCQHLQFDEIWGFIGKKERHCRPDDSLELGDVWTFCAIDSETKLVPSFKCGKRDLVTANAFVSDVASRVRNRVQISSDALSAYVQAIETNFGADVDFAQIVKTYITDDSRIPERRFSAPEIVVTEKKAVSGFPDLRKASTSHIERLNGTTRLHMRRLTRLTYAFSKKLENFEAAVALHFAYYNFVKRHITLRATPAMAAGVEKSFWTIGDLVEATV
jgi:IS1 family transposase